MKVLLLYIDIGPNLLRARRLLLTGLLALSACVVAPQSSQNSNWNAQRELLQELDSWQFRGRIDVRYNNDSDTPRIQWQQQDQEYRIRLWGTFNAGNTLITGRTGSVTMESRGETITASSPEQLILQQLGYELPVSYLEYWIKGLPAPGERAELEFNELNQLSLIRQADWTVTYNDPRQYGDLSLPANMILTRPANDIRLRFIGLNWTLPEAVQ